MKDNIVFNKITDWSLEKEFTLMMRYTMEHQSVLQEDRLDRKSRQVLVVKRLNQRLCKNSKCLQSGFVRMLFKRKGQNFQASDMQEMLMVLRQKSVEFFTSNKRTTSEEKKLDLQEDKPLHNWGIKNIKNIQDYTCKHVINLRDILQIKETQKSQNDERGVGKGMLNVLTFGKREENAVHKNFVFKIKYRVSSQNKMQAQSSIYIQNASDRKQDINEAENWMTAIEFLRTKLAFEEFSASYGQVPFPLPSLDLQRQSRPNEHPRRMQPVKTLISEMKAMPSLPQNLHGTFAIFNQASSVQFLPGSQIDQLNPFQRLQSSSQLQLTQGRSQLSRQHNGNKESVKKLAKKIKTLFGVTYLSFLGHMQASTHSSLSNDEESQKPVLGNISVTLQNQFRKQLDDVLDFNMFTTPRLAAPFSSIFSPLKDAHQESQEEIVSPESFAETQSVKKFEIMPHQALQSAPSAYIEDQTMQLFREDERAQVSRIRQTKTFVHGQRLCEATMCRLDNDEAFTLLRRQDVLGYNDSRRPFIDHSEIKPKRPTKQVGQQTLQGELSIMALQSTFQLPGPEKRKEKGQVIEKILENSSKPWYLQTGQLTEESEVEKSEVKDEVMEVPIASHIISPRERHSESYRNHEGAYMAFKRALTVDAPQVEAATTQPSKQSSSKQHSKQPSIFELLEQEEEKVITASRKTSELQSRRLTTQSVQEQVISTRKQSRVSAQHQQETAQSFLDFEQQAEASPIETLQLVTAPTLPTYIHKSIATEINEDESPLVTDTNPISHNVDHEKFLNQGMPAIVIAPQGAPCIVLNTDQTGGRRQILLACNEVVYIDRDLYAQGNNKPVLLTKCYFFVEGGMKIDIVVARNLLRVIDSEEIASLQKTEVSYEEDSSFYSNEEQIERKVIQETSADNLLRQSPTLLNFYLKPKVPSNDLNQLQSKVTFTKLQQRRMERQQTRQLEERQRSQKGTSTERSPQQTSRSPPTQKSPISTQEKVSSYKQSTGVVVAASSSAVPRVLKVNERRKQRLLEFN